jgi:chromosome segregation ATPase
VFWGSHCDQRKRQPLARSRVLRLLDRATAYQVELAELSRKLADIDLDAVYQELSPLRTRLEAVETRITEIEQQRIKKRDELQTAVRSLKDGLDDQSDRWIDLDITEKAKSDELETGIATIQQAIAKDQLDEADDLLRKAKRHPQGVRLWPLLRG